MEITLILTLQSFFYRETLNENRLDPHSLKVCISGMSSVILNQENSKFKSTF